MKATGPGPGRGRTRNRPPAGRGKPARVPEHDLSVSRPKEPPIRESLLILNGEGHGPVNSLTVPSLVAPTYAPEGQALIAVSIIGMPPMGDAQLTEAVRSQVAGWFGPKVSEWRHLRTYWTRYALPLQIPPLPDPTAPVHPGGASGALRLRRIRESSLPAMGDGIRAQGG